MTQAHDPKFPQSSSGSLYPKNYVVGVIDNHEEAQQALQAFQKAGFPAEELRLMEGDEALQKTEELDKEKNIFQRFFSSFQGKTDETGVEIYRMNARHGRHILHVHADSDEQVEKIAALMQQYHGHAIKYFGPWSVADIPPRSLPQH